jgi:transposase
LIVSEVNNGELLVQPRLPKTKRHNAKLCPFAIRQRIVSALANGDSKRAIARALRVSNNTVTAIAEQEWQRVEARKARIASQAERAATLAADRINAKLESKDDIPLSTLVPVFGVAVDKLTMLRGDAALTHTQQNLHLYLQSNNVTETFNNLVRSLEEKAKQLRAIPSPPPALTDERPDTEQRESPVA